MNNEYVVYWRREVLYRTKVVANSEEEALKFFNKGFDNDDYFMQDFDEFENMSVDNVELIEKDAK
jgi:hypothetical protein